MNMLRRNVNQMDPVGQQTMSPAMADMQAYPAYLLRQVESAIGHHVWEIGIGNGQASIALLQRGCKVLATDIDSGCLDSLTRRVDQTMPEVRFRLQLARIDLNQSASVESLRVLGADSVVTFNVLEHIEDDGSALAAIAKTVAPHGRLGIVVPAMPGLYGKMDLEAGHYRRYTRAGLIALLERSGWCVISCRYINALGALGWWFHNRVRTDAGLRDPGFNRHMRFSDRWLPRAARVTDPLMAKCFGLSLVAIATSPAAGFRTD